MNMDFQQLLSQMQGAGGSSPQLDRLQQVLRSEQGQNMAQSLSPEMTARVRQAAEAAQRGDLQSAGSAVAAILSTPEGAALAAQLRTLFGK